MKRLIIHRTSFVIVLLLFFKFNSNAQDRNIVYYENNKIAVKQQNDSIYFYDSSGELRKIINLKNKKSTPFGLPKEVQDIIYDGKIPERIEISEETFPTYLYRQRYTDAGIVLCSEHVYYNELGLKTRYKEICPNDIAGDDDYHFGDKNLYKYNKYGLPTEVEGAVYKYNGNGQLVEKCYQDTQSKKIRCSSKYKYQNGKLIASISNLKTSKNNLSYVYNDKGQLSEIIQSSRSKIVIQYNYQKKVTSLSEVKTWRDKKYKRTYLTYHYDAENRIEKIQIHGLFDNSDDYRFIYDSNGNLTQKMLNGKVIESFNYNNDGTLIYIRNNKRWGEDKGHVKY
ncbi:RHS repeat domain-containing protein [Aquimarina sp. 2201CG14-23]|uniref:RHS repeat domain-containing protein n=1 Tax=Aquimarina mycalae TaxID=3040073 RepID=UPI002477EC1A|nr:hypothetical protein [Aquimarina sp. 2201CG14-23]MDH7447625.1 hypothetical protein [Aquimarina sp. 2201CG14-23]